MQLITAIIQPFMLDRLTRALRMHEVTGYTVTELKGSGRDLANSPDYLRPRVKIEIAANDDDAAQIIELISETVSTHQEGDGVVYALPLSSFANIQSGLVGSEALSKRSRKGD